jgi:glyoxalase/bleomycin resistance protein/dioxygenase superfamily protein
MQILSGLCAHRPTYHQDMNCYCCGEERDDSMVTGLHCHDEIKVCRVCVGWLRQRVGGIDVTPTLPVADMVEAIRFCEAAGFDVERYDDGFAFVHLHDQSVFDLDLVADLIPETNHAGCYIITADVDEWHARLVAAGLPVTPVEDMPWGMHEFTLTGPSGNNLRVGRGITDST